MWRGIIVIIFLASQYNCQEQEGDVVSFDWPWLAIDEKDTIEPMQEEYSQEDNRSPNFEKRSYELGSEKIEILLMVSLEIPNP